MTCQRSGIRIGLLLTIESLCLFEFILRLKVKIFRELEVALLSLEWMLAIYLLVWCGFFLFLAFSLKDFPLIGLLLIAVVFYFISYAMISPVTDAIILLAGVTLGRGMQFLLKADERSKMEDGMRIGGDEVTSLTSKSGNNLETSNIVFYFLVGQVMLLAFGSWWHWRWWYLDVEHYLFLRTRWTGLWNNPNTYGMLMGAEIVTAAGLLLAHRRWKMGDGLQKRRLFSICYLPTAILWIGVGMLGVGLVMSYSRGAWLGTAIGLLYLAWSYGKLKWRYVLSVAAVAAAVVLYLWGSTPDSAPWYVKRADLGRPSAHNRATAWRAGLEIMRDHPLGVGWNSAVKVYGEKYHPPEGGPDALATNDYLMLGTELGIPALLCFVAYVGLCYRKSPRLTQCKIQNEKFEMEPTPSSWPSPPVWEKESEALRAACLAGALVFIVAFWFDGGLFDLPTAAMFWVLLELGSAQFPNKAPTPPSSLART